MADADTPSLPPGLRPDPLTPAQVRARRATRLAVIRASQRAGLTPLVPVRPSGGLSGEPGRILFEVEDVPRCAVVVSAAACEVIWASSHQGRLWPQALEEVFGAGAPGVACVRVDLLPKARPFPDHEDVQGVAYPDQETEAPDVVCAHVLAQRDAWLFRVTAEHADPTIEPYTWLVNASDLMQLHPENRHPLFNAVLSANELLRFYPHAHVPAPAPELPERSDEEA